jgi:hypothetical protein
MTDDYTDDAEITEALEEEEPFPIPPRIGELQELVDELILAVEGARTVPLSANVMLDRERLLDMLYRLRDGLPDELRMARWMVREREAFVARTNEKARDMIERAKERSDELVAESYIVKEAVDEANAMIRHAESEATRIRLEAEDYSDSAFGETESVLADLLGQVRRARGELHQTRKRPDLADEG